MNRKNRIETEEGWCVLRTKLTARQKQRPKNQMFIDQAQLLRISWSFRASGHRAIEKS